MDVYGKMYGTAASLHKRDSLFYGNEYAIGRMRRKGFFMTFSRRIHCIGAKKSGGAAGQARPEDAHRVRNSVFSIEGMFLMT